MTESPIVKPQSDRPSHIAADMQGVSRALFDAVSGATDIAESLHHTILTLGGILGGRGPFGRASESDGSTQGPKTKGITGAVYRNIRSITEWVGTGVEAPLQPLASVVKQGESRFDREVMIAILNGVCGDYLERTNNPLVVDMQLYQGNAQGGVESVPSTGDAIRQAQGRIVVMLHGVCMSDVQWTRQSHNHGASLATAMQAVPLYLHYNSGRHISHNGRDLAQQLQRLHATYPEITDITLVGYSMGGLVARSACYYANQMEADWLDKFAALACLGSPHHGAPLEQAGHWVDSLLGSTLYSRAFQKLSQLRSAGITDLRYGNIIDDDWHRHDRFERVGDQRCPVPLPGFAKCFALAALTQEQLPEQVQANAQRLQQWVGDGLVPVDSALGRHPKEQFTLSFPSHQQAVITGCHHLELLSDTRVAKALVAWLT